MEIKRFVVEDGDGNIGKCARCDGEFAVGTTYLMEYRGPAFDARGNHLVGQPFKAPIFHEKCI